MSKTPGELEGDILQEIEKRRETLLDNLGFEIASLPGAAMYKIASTVAENHGVIDLGNKDSILHEALNASILDSFQYRATRIIEPNSPLAAKHSFSPEHITELTRILQNEKVSLLDKSLMDELNRTIPLPVSDGKDKLKPPLSVDEKIKLIFQQYPKSYTTLKSFASIANAIDEVEEKLHKAVSGGILTPDDAIKLRKDLETVKDFASNAIKTDASIAQCVRDNFATKVVNYMQLADVELGLRKFELLSPIKSLIIIPANIASLLRDKDSPDRISGAMSAIVQSHVSKFFGPIPIPANSNGTEIDIQRLKDVNQQRLFAETVNKDLQTFVDRELSGKDKVYTQKESEGFKLNTIRHTIKSLNSLNQKLHKDTLPADLLKATETHLSQHLIPTIDHKKLIFPGALAAEILPIIRKIKDTDKRDSALTKALHEVSTKFISAQIIENAFKKAPDSQKDTQAENLTKIILKSKIPLSTLADPAFQTAISEQISKDGKVNSKKLQAALDSYDKRPALTRSTSEPLPPLRSSEEKPAERPHSAPIESTAKREKAELANGILDQVNGILEAHFSKTFELDETERKDFHRTLQRSNISVHELSNPEIQQRIAIEIAGRIEKEITKGTDTQAVMAESLSEEDIQGIIDRAGVERKEPGRPNTKIFKLEGDHLESSSTETLTPTTARKIYVKAAEHPVDLTQNEPPVQEKKVEQKPSKTQTLETKTPISKTLAGKALHAVKALAAFVKPKKNNEVAPAPFEKPKTDTKTR